MKKLTQYTLKWLWYQGTLISANCPANVYTVVDNKVNWSALTKRYTMIILTGADRYENWHNAIHTLWRYEEGHKVAVIAAETRFECERGDHTASATTYPLNADIGYRFENTHTYILNFLFVSGYKSLEDTIYQEKISRWFKWFGPNKPTIIIAPDHLEISHQLQRYCRKKNISYIIVYSGGFIKDGKYYYN